MEWTPIEFLKRFHPDRVWVLTAINPSEKGIDTRWFRPDQWDHAAAWIEKYNGDRNIYFSVAEVIEPENKKASKANVDSVHWLHVDIDAQAGDLLAELGRIRHLVTDQLPTGAPKPTVVLYSGGGYQAFWKLAQPIPIGGMIQPALEAERYNRQLELIFGGDSCHDVSRIMRLPCTVNVPNARKAARGRVPVQAEVVYFDEKLVYSLSQFTPAADVGRTADAGDVQISGNIQRLNSIDDLCEWDVPDRIKVICVQGHDPEEPKEGDNSRSAWLFDAVCGMVRCDVPDDVIYSVITDPGFKIAESVLEVSNTDRYAKKQIKSAKEAAESEWLARLNDKYAVIGNLGGRCMVIEEVYDEAMKRHRLVKQSFTDFRNRYMNQSEQIQQGDKTKLVPVGRWWLENSRRRQYDRLVFEPGKDIPGAYNLWRGYGCNALPGEAHLSFLRHLFDTVCATGQAFDDFASDADREAANPQYAYLLGWLARAIQHPNLPGHTAVVMRGRPGTGKSFFAKHFGHLFGRHFIHVSNASHLVGNFNSHLRDAIVVFGDEAFYAGDKKHESVLKTLVTEESLIIEAKGVDAEASPNYTHLILASNSDWVVPVGNGDRRYFIVDVSEKFAQNTKHFGAIAADLENGGYENLLHFLMHYDLEGFNVQAIPETEAKTDHRVTSLEDTSPLDHAIYEMLNTGEVPCEVIEDGTLFHANWLLDYLKRTYPAMRMTTLTPRALGQRLRKFGFTGGHRADTMKLQQPPVDIEQARRDFATVTGGSWAWDELPSGWSGAGKYRPGWDD